ncbi:MAG: hypothetical protein LBR98_09450, partial [Syntrophomonadaceae bacterium]|nr:hypothetical protein [Syntrophomonadaceae bacterium]
MCQVIVGKSLRHTKKVIKQLRIIRKSLQFTAKMLCRHADGDGNSGIYQPYVRRRYPIIAFYPRPVK